MKILIFAFAAILVSGATSAATYDWSAEGLTPGREAEFRLWIPEEADAVGCLIVLAPGRNGDSRTWIEDPAWQALARRWNCGLLGSLLTGDYYYVAKEWSGVLLLKALAAFAAKSGHPGLTDARLAFFGHSTGGQFSCSFVDWRPERVLAFVACKGNLKEWNLDANKRAVPGLWIIGRKDSESIAENMTGSFCEGRRLGAPWALAVQPNGGHEIGEGQNLAIAYFDAILAAPNEKTPWIGNLRTHEISPASVPTPDFQLNAWLPDREFADAWKNFTGGKALTP